MKTTFKRLQEKTTILSIVFSLAVTVNIAQDDTGGKLTSAMNDFLALPGPSVNYNHEVMVLGVFHFNRGGDGSDVVAQKHIDITTAENQAAISNLNDQIIKNFRPTKIAVEWMPERQETMDSLFTEYKKGNWDLSRNEAFQIGFKIAKELNLSGVQCIDNRPPQPETVTSVDDWDAYAAQLGHEELWHEYDTVNAAYNTFVDELQVELSLHDYLAFLNSPEITRRNNQFWVTGLVNLGYGDKYLGADLTGHWYRRNTRLMVNVRNLCETQEERILVIYGNAHKWVLEELFNASPEFTVRSFDEVIK